MITWLDRLARICARRLDEQHHGGDPRRALAFYVGQILAHLAERRHLLGPAESIFMTTLAPFIREFLPPDETVTFLADGLPPPRLLGLLLTRPTANLLSAAGSAGIRDELWRAKLGLRRAIHVDIPQGAIVLNGDVNGNDALQLRAMLAAPYLPPDDPDSTLFIAQLTDRGSDRERGRLIGVLKPDGGISGAFGSRPNGFAANGALSSPLFDPITEESLGIRAGTFLRLVLAYYFFGPMEARQPIAATPAEKLRAGKPRKDESLFALTRLNPTASTGRPRDTIPRSWSLTSHQEVTGHFKLQPHGPGGSLRKLIWVAGYDRGPENAPLRPKAYRI
jgi:hypothetical protein